MFTNAVNGIKDTVTNVWNSISTITTTVWEGIKSAITKPISAAVDFVKEQIERIKNFFSNLTISLPHINLPHFSISGGFSLNPPKVPSFGVEWYDKGGIFTRPSIIGVGEKRPEFVGALEDLKGIVREVVNETKGTGGITQNITIISPKALSERELAREFRNTSKKLAMGVI